MSQTVFHISAYKVKDSAVLPKLLAAVQEVNNAKCVKPDGSKYILSVKGGKQMSPEGFDNGIQLVFIIEFKCEEDLMYYLNEDPAHVAFKTTCIEKFGLDGGVVVDFGNGAF